VTGTTAGSETTVTKPLDGGKDPKSVASFKPLSLKTHARG
jgi:hypothetical protein